MRITLKLIILLFLAASMSACVTKKKFKALQTQLDNTNKTLDAANLDLGKSGERLSELSNKLSACQQELERMKGEDKGSQTSIRIREEQIQDLKDQIADCKAQRDKQNFQVSDLTQLNKSANDNIKETLSQLNGKDQYIHLLQAAKTKTDSINLALAVNLKSVLREGVADEDVDVKVDKTVVFINLSDKMLYQSGSAILTPKAQDVLGKIAKIIESRPDLEVMVEGYTDNIPISNDCTIDNWDLSVKRATAVVRVLQNVYKINPNKLIAAGRGEYNTLAPNTTEAGRATNRRTRIIILPKIDQFYDLLNPNNVPK